MNRSLLLYWFWIAVLWFYAAFAVHGAAPELQRLEPTGGQRGSEFDMSIKGKWSKWPPQFWCDTAGIEFKPGEKEGLVRVKIAADTPPITAKIRLFDKEGPSEIRHFCVDPITTNFEQESNDDWLKPQFVELPRIVYGTLNKRNDVDGYGVQLKAKQKIFINVDARRHLNSPLDACLQVVGPKGIVLAQMLDSRGLDPQLSFVAPYEGSFIVRVFGFPETPDSTIGFAGGDNYQYRLTITDAGYLDAAWPLAVQSKSDATVFARGFLGVDNQQALTRSMASDVRSEWVYAPSLTGAVKVALVEVPVVEEQVSVSEGSAQSIELPCDLTGCIESTGDKDTFDFIAEKDQLWDFRMISEALGYPLDAVIEISDSDGKSLVQSDDSKQERDPVLTWKAPAQGHYRVTVRDLYGFGGSDFYYRLSVVPKRIAYAAKVAEKVLQGSVGAPLEVAVSIERPEKGKDELEIRLEGLPDGIKSEPALSVVGGDSEKTAKCRLESGTAFQGPIRCAIYRRKPEGNPEGSGAQGAEFVMQIDDLWLKIE